MVVRWPWSKTLPAHSTAPRRKLAGAKLCAKAPGTRTRTSESGAPYHSAGKVPSSSSATRYAISACSKQLIWRVRKSKMMWRYFTIGWRPWSRHLTQTMVKWASKSSVTKFSGSSQSSLLWKFICHAESRKLCRSWRSELTRWTYRQLSANLLIRSMRSTDLWALLSTNNIKDSRFQTWKLTRPCSKLKYKSWWRTKMKNLLRMTTKFSRRTCKSKKGKPRCRRAWQHAKRLVETSRGASRPTTRTFRRSCWGVRRTTQVPSTTTTASKSAEICRFWGWIVWQSSCRTATQRRASSSLTCADRGGDETTCIKSPMWISAMTIKRRCKTSSSKLIRRFKWKASSRACRRQSWTTIKTKLWCSTLIYSRYHVGFLK